MSILQNLCGCKSDLNTQILIQNCFLLHIVFRTNAIQLERVTLVKLNRATVDRTDINLRISYTKQMKYHHLFQNNNFLYTVSYDL